MAPPITTSLTRRAAFDGAKETPPVPYLYKPLPDEDPRAPAWCRFVLPRGSDRIVARAADRGWHLEPPAGAVVYTEAGDLLQGEPHPPAESALPVDTASDEPKPKTKKGD